MPLSTKKSKHSLHTAYANLVKKSVQIQKNGDIQAYATNALQAEKIAEELQALSRLKQPI